VIGGSGARFSFGLETAKFFFTRANVKREKTRAPMMVGSMTICHNDGTELANRIAARLELCRAADCINACWGWSSKEYFRIRPFAGRKLKIWARTPAAGAEPQLRFWEEQSHDDIEHALPLGDPLHDSVQFEDLFMLIHHLYFGRLCKLKTSAATAPLGRLEAIEGQVQDLMRLVQDNEPDSKRQKTQ